MKKLALLLTVCSTLVAGDTNWPHYGYTTISPFTQREAPHRVSWHDGFNGPELVRVEIATNVFRTPSLMNPRVDYCMTNRVVNVIASGLTNEVIIDCLGSGYEAPPKPQPVTGVIVTNYYLQPLIIITNPVFVPGLYLNGIILPNLTNLPASTFFTH